MDLEELAKQYGGVSTKVEPVNLEKLAKELGGTSRPVKERTVTEAFTDPAAKFASGIGQLIQFPGQIYGLTTGAIKDKDFGTTGLQGLGQNLQDYAKKKLSEQYLAEEAETARKVEEAEKKGQLAAFGTQVGEVLKNPLTQGIGFAAEQIPQAIPSAIAALIPGAGPALAAELRAAQAAAKAAVGNVAKKEAADAALKLAQDAALKSQISRGTKAAIGTGAVQQGADIGSGSFEEIKQYLIAEKGLNEDQAAAQALNLARAAGVSGTAISLLAQKLPGAQALERALAGERLGAGRIKGAVAGALKNIPGEMVEEGGGKFTQNLALRDVNPEQSLTAGLGQTLGQAALGAGVIGGGAGAISGGKPTINPEDVKNAEFEKRKAEDIQRATEKRAEIAAQMEVVKNPVGALTEADLGPELTSYVNEHRTATGKPTLTTYSLDDVVDALPGKDKVKEAGALNALIAQKTGYTAEVYTPDAITALAEQKNVDVNAPGFGDFLFRSTGISDPAQMSQPQLHSAVTALQKLPTFETKQELPEGTNATRYSPEQLTKAIDGLNAKLDEVGKDELSFKETTKVVETATGLKGSAVNALLNDATKSGSIVTEGNKVSVPSRSTPSGYDIQEEIGVEEEQAESYDVMSGDKKVRSFETQEQADAHAEKLNSFAQAELKKTQEDLKAQDAKISKSENELHKFELNQATDTPAYKAAEEAHQAVLDEAMPVIADLKNQEEIYSRPVSVVPVGVKKVTPKTYRVTKGETVKGTKATREEAEQSIFEDLSDKEIQELAKTKSPKLQARLNAEIARRSTAPAPTPRTAEQQQKIQAAQATLQSMLARFGLQDVALKIVNAIEQGAEGSYAAKVIQLAIDAQNPVRVMRHEALHALKELGFFTDSQWASLQRQANAEWINKYLKGNQTRLPDGRIVSRYDAYIEVNQTMPAEWNKNNPDQPPRAVMSDAEIKELLEEEAIADAFGDFDGGKAPPGMLNALLNKLRNFFSTLKSYLNGQGYESYKDIFGKIEKGELKPSKPAEANKEAKKSLPVVPEQRSYKLDIEREKRKVAKSASLTQEETDAVMADAERLNLNDAKIREIINGIKDDKKRYPSSEGWADLKVIGVDSKLDDDGKPIAGTETPKYAPISYAYNVPPGASKAPNKVDQVWLGKVTNKFQGLIQDLYKRAAEGDVNAKNIIAHQTWYKNVAATLRQEFGGFGDTLADLLGATSPNTPVDTNWRFSIDVMRRFVRGDFDTEMRKFVKYLDDGKSPSKYPAEDKIRQISGKLYGMNSTNAMLALADTWRAIKPGQAPKARNFALNLIGQSNMATIDVWAARMLRRAADMVKGAKFPRIPPPAEQGVSGTWNADATKVTGAFGFGAEVMQKVSDNLAKKGINIAPPDLQAIAWFAEKELWGTKGWTTKTGEGGSFEENIEGQPTERYIAGHSVQQGSEKPETEAIKQAQGQVTRLLSKDKGVLAFRVKETAGLYGGEVEESFDTEIVVDKDKFDPTDLVKALSSISKENNQWDIFVSKVLAPAQERSLNARPGVEIYFKTPQDMAKIMPILEKFTSRGQDGFTLAVDPRVDDGTEQYMGVRLQYVPEISMRWDEDLRQQFLTPTGLSKVMNEKRALLDDIVADVAQMDGVAYASAVDYDTVVIGKENYSDYINGRTAGANQAVGKNPWFGEPLREHVERAITRLEGKQGQVGEGNVPSVGEEPSQKLSLRTSFPTAKAAEDAAYRKAPPTTDAFKRWFGRSIVKEEGRPQVMYHASMEDFPAFRENRAIFVSPDPYFVEDFIQRRISESGSLQYLSEGNLKTKTAKIYPVWVRAEKPFDYENPDHVQQVVDDVTADFTSKEKGNRIQLATHLVSPKDLFDRLSNAQWDYIEDGRIQQAIKKLGFDSFYTLEGGAKNLALYNANQVKSATGNTGEFGETKDMRFSLRNVDTPEFKRFFADSKVVDEDGEPLVVYHGSKTKVTQFDSKFSKDEGFFFSNDYTDAENYGGEVISAYLSLQKPYVVTWSDISEELNGNPDLSPFAIGKDELQSRGYDGFIVKADKQSKQYDAEYGEPEYANNQYVAFKPTQIKSATENTGAFDPTNPDIRYSLRNVDTPEFKRFFGDSKVVNADGKPLVMYHGTPYDYVSKGEIAAFNTKDFGALLGKGSYFTSDPVEAEAYAGKSGMQYGSKPNIIPAYISLQNPLIVDSVLDKIPKRQELKDAGYDGVLLRKKDGSVQWAVAFEPTQIKSATGNIGTYDPTNPDIRYSFPSIADQIAQTKNGKDINDSILGTTTVREEEGFVERMMSAISPEARSSFRAKAINRYNQMSVNDKKMAQAMGGIELLADASAEFAALQSDTSAGVAAAVMGYGESKGGVPVYEKGYTTVSDLNGTVKGLTELLMPLAVRGDPYIYRAFQFYSGVKRGTRLDAEGKEKLFDKKDIQYAKDLELLYPEFKQVHADWIKYNNGHVDYMVKTGVLTPEKGNIFKKYADYIPFYRQLEGEETFGPNIFQSLANVKAPKKIKGGEAPLADFLETVVRNTQASVQSGMKNIAATRAIDQALFLGTASQLPQVSSAPNTVTLLRNGIPVSYAVSDRLLFDSMQSLNLPEMPFLGILAGPANLLRNLVTKDPGFMLANMMRDSLAAYATSGADITPMVDTIRNFGRVMANRSPEFYALMNAGAIGGYDFSKDVATSGGELAKDLRRKSKTQTDTEKALRPITSLWGFLEKSTEASDAATRIAVYKDVLARTGNEAEAIRQAIEVMNFNRKGSSPIIRIVTAAIPFLNARIQGLDVLYRAGMAPRPAGVSKTDHQRRVQKNFIIRGTTMMALSSMYWFLMQDDEEYKKQEQEVRDNNWILPMIGARIPIPFEVGVLFKVIPERILAFAFGGDTGEDLANSMERALRSTFGVNYIPQTVLPLVEATTNYSYFTMRPIVSQGLEGVRPGLQVGPSTTQIAQAVGNALNVSPIKIDHVVQGYTGTMGMYLVSAIDAIFDSMSDVQKPSLRPDQYPIVKRFAINKEAKGTVSAYFQLKDAVDETVRTVNILKSTGQGDELSNYLEGEHRMFGLKTASLLGARGYITDMDAKMKPLLENAKKIRASDMDPDEKRDALSSINEALINITSDIQEIKKGLSE